MWRSLCWLLALSLISPTAACGRRGGGGGGGVLSDAGPRRDATVDPVRDGGGSSSDTGGSTGRCAPVIGTYAVSYTVIDGSCTELPAEPVTFAEDACASDAPPEGCTGTQGCSADGCAYLTDLSCNNAGYFVMMRGTLEISSDGSSLEGTVDASVTDSAGAEVCAGTWLLTMTRSSP